MGQPNTKVKEPTPKNQAGIRNGPAPLDDALLTRRLRGSPPPDLKVEASESSPKTVPVVVRFAPPNNSLPLAAAEVTMNGKTQPMTRSGDDFFAIMYAPPGENSYVVRWKVEGGSEVLEQGGQKITVTDALLHNKEDDDAADDGSGWGQQQTVFEETRKNPPILPPHLRYTPLNTPPTQFRCNAEGTLVPAENLNLPLDPVHLPLPLSVTVNHVYFQRREDHTVLGVTTRYKNKFTSIVYYRGTA